MKHYQSWTKDINSLKLLSYKINNPVIIEAYAHDDDYAIDISTILNRVCNSSRYEQENEITVPVRKDNILRMYRAKLNPIEEVEEIPKEDWFMDSWYDL